MMDHRHRRRLILGSVALALVLAVSAAVFALRRGGNGPEREREGVFGSRTGTILIFDDGARGVRMVDLDRRLEIRRPDIGNQAGDQPYRLIRAGDRLVVGRETISTAPLGVGPASTLGEATYFVPGSLGDDVWLVDHAGAPPGSPAPLVRHVEVDGEPLIPGGAEDVVGPAALTNPSGPPIGVASALVTPTPAGLEIWGMYPDHLGEGSARVLDVWGAFLAWCDRACRRVEVQLYEGGGAAFRTPDLDSPVTTVALAPYLDHVAVATADRSVFLAERATFTELRVTELPGVPPGDAPLSLEWSRDGGTLFVAEQSQARDATGIGRYQVGGALEWETLPVGGLGGLVIATADEVGELPEARDSASDCPPSPEVCTISFD